MAWLPTHVTVVLFWSLVQIRAPLPMTFGCSASWPADRSTGLFSSVGPLRFSRCFLGMSYLHPKGLVLTGGCHCMGLLSWLVQTFYSVKTLSWALSISSPHRAVQIGQSQFGHGPRAGELVPPAHTHWWATLFPHLVNRVTISALQC